MTQIIYADLLFIINMLVDFIILIFTGLLSEIGLNFKRITFSALTGAVTAVCIICIFPYGFAYILYTVSFPLILILIAFGRRQIKTFIYITLYFYLSSALLYGGICAMISVISMISGTTEYQVGFAITVLVIAVTAFGYLIFSAFSQRGMKNSTGYVNAELNDGNRTYNLTLLADSGNLAKDPFSAKPVVILKADVLDEALVNAVCHSFPETEPEPAYRHIKPRVIPMKTVSGTTLLYAFIPEKLYIIKGKKKIRADCITAIDMHKNSFFGKDGIIPTSLLTDLL